MNAAAKNELPAAPSRLAQWTWLTGLAQDGSIRFSIKFGLAGILALFVALLNKNQEPSWAIFTVFVLMVAQYIGAIEEKSILRIIGTIIGGFFGYIITAGFEQDPLIYFSLLGLFVAFATAMFGQSRSPYAYLLCAMTAVVVCSNGLADPQNSWKYMIWRIQEVVIGIMCVLVVQSLLWPRYAADEFQSGLRAAFLDLREMLDAVRSGRPITESSYQNRLNQLMQLLRFGGRESSYFRARIPTHLELLDAIRRIHGAIRPLADLRWKNAPCFEKAKTCAAEFQEAIMSQLAILGSAKTPSADLCDERLKAIDAASENLRQTILDIRHDPRAADVSVDDILDIGLECLSLEEIRQELAHCHELLAELPLKSKKSPDKSLHKLIPGVPTSFWITNGIRSAASLIVAMVISNWAHSPGGTTMILCAWLFCCLLPISPEGRGDKRAWHVVMVAIPCLLGLCLVLIAATPLLSSYAVMNIVIFTWLFLYGQVAYKTPGVTTAMNIAMMGLVGILGLNAQVPVQFQSIADIFFGVSTGTIIAAFFQRTLWPLLPQREMRDRFAELVRLQRETLDSHTPDRETLMRLGQLPTEILLRISNLAPTVHRADEIAKLRSLIDHLDGFTGNRIWDSDPGEVEGGREITRKIRNGFAEILANIEHAFSSGQACQTDTSKLKSVIAEFDSWILEVRLKLVSRNVDPSITTYLIGRAARYRNAAAHLIAATEITSQLNTSIYSKDNAL